jgi:hypothetical protein
MGGPKLEQFPLEPFKIGQCLLGWLGLCFPPFPLVLVAGVPLFQGVGLSSKHLGQRLCPLHSSRPSGLH